MGSGQLQPHSGPFSRWSVSPSQYKGQESWGTLGDQNFQSLLLLNRIWLLMPGRAGQPVGLGPAQPSGLWRTAHCVPPGLSWSASPQFPGFSVPQMFSLAEPFLLSSALTLPNQLYVPFLPPWYWQLGHALGAQVLQSFLLGFALLSLVALLGQA